MVWDGVDGGRRWLREWTERADGAAGTLRQPPTHASQRAPKLPDGPTTASVGGRVPSGKYALGSAEVRWE